MNHEEHILSVRIAKNLLSVKQGMQSEGFNSIHVLKYLNAQTKHLLENASRSASWHDT